MTKNRLVDSIAKVEWNEIPNRTLKTYTWSQYLFNYKKNNKSEHLIYRDGHHRNCKFTEQNILDWLHKMISNQIVAAEDY